MVELFLRSGNLAFDRLVGKVDFRLDSKQCLERRTKEISVLRTIYLRPRIIGRRKNREPRRIRCHVEGSGFEHRQEQAFFGSFFGIANEIEKREIGYDRRGGSIG